MQIRDHRLLDAAGRPVRFQASPNVGGLFQTPSPRYLVLHYTAGTTLEGAVSWFSSPRARVSAHVVVGRDGALAQCVPLDRIAWHAGRSGFAGLSDLNRHAIGIEFVNLGPLAGGPGRYRDAAGRSIADEDVALVGPARRPWHRFPAAQMDAGADVAAAILHHFGLPLAAIVGHEDIAPGRKIDPGPAFDRAAFLVAIVARRSHAVSDRNIPVDKIYQR